MSTSPVPVLLQQQINDWRRRAAENTLTPEEMKAAVIFLRQGRVNAAAASATAKRKTAVKLIPKASDLLAELDGL
tara:strand:+ start:3349 stop:3573 length:225 start_codon:yes stop_codon:yes gene_type:complete